MLDTAMTEPGRNGFLVSACSDNLHIVRGGTKTWFVVQKLDFFVYPGIFHCGLVCKIRIWFCFFSIMLFDPPYQGVKNCIFALQVIFEKCFKWLEIQHKFGP